MLVAHSIQCCPSRRDGMLVESSIQCSTSRRDGILVESSIQCSTSRRDGMFENQIEHPIANTYTQLHIQFVFAVQNRISLIQPTLEEELFKYITGILKNHKHKMIAINGMLDHVHLFVGLHPTQSISSLMQTVKGESSEWINKKRFIKGKFGCKQARPGLLQLH